MPSPRLRRVPARPRTLFSIRETFRIPAAPELLVEGFERAGTNTPPIDPHYVFPAEDTLALLLGLTHGDGILIWGPPGSGKTSLVEQVAARLRTDVIRDPEHAEDLPGAILLLEGSIATDAASWITGPRHDGPHVVATITASGPGDAPSVRDAARFSLTIRRDYPPEDEEVEIVLARFSREGFGTEQARWFVGLAQLLRAAHDQGEIAAPVTVGDVLSWVAKSFLLGDRHKAARYAFVNRFSPRDATAIETILQRAIG